MMNERIPLKKTIDSNQEKKENDKAKQKIVKRLAKEVKNGMTINLGIGVPTMLPGYIPKDIEIVLHSQNGILGYGEYPLTRK